ncbi:MAG: 50S ribosomal protein L9 [Treponema sp.]|jgi:large subunit ribosomal protein L9|nr:50S ribosomal protein L9 [Treponema sp.]
MKVILNKDLPTLGEEGDVKDVAKGYARNYLFPRGIALPYNEGTVKLFEARKGEIETRKAEKRDAAKGLKERIEALELVITMPAGANGRLFGSVTSQTVADELARLGFQVERKRIELPGASFKNVGKYKVTVRLYESALAELGLTVQAQIIEKTPESPAKGRRRTGEARTSSGSAAENPAGAETVPAEEGSPAPETSPETAAETGGVSGGTAPAETGNPQA